MADRPYMGFKGGYNSSDADSMLSELYPAMAQATKTGLGNVKTGLGNIWNSMDNTSKAATVVGLVPGIGQVGDLAGLADDARLFYQNPEMRTPANFGLSALGLLPLIPSMGMVKGVGKGISGSIVPSMPTVPKEPEQLGMIADDVLAEGNKQIQEMEGLVPPVQRVAPSGLVVANKYEKGIIQGKPGDLHFSVHNDPQSKKMGELLATGFADSQGNFYDRNQALEFVRQSNPDQIGMQDYLKRASGLDAKDYNATTGVGITDAIPEARKYNIVPPVKKQGK
jgi:hypothetical protein